MKELDIVVNGAIGRMNLPRKAENQEEEEPFLQSLRNPLPNTIDTWSLAYHADYNGSVKKTMTKKQGFQVIKRAMTKTVI